MRNRWILLSVVLGCMGIIAATAMGLDAPHNAATHSSFDPVCGTCHIPHNGYGSLLNPAKGATVNDLCEGCHSDGQPAATRQVYTHGSARETQDCDFCVYDFEVACTNCHDPHAHEQPLYDMGGLYGGAFLQEEIKLYTESCVSSPCLPTFHHDETVEPNAPSTCVADSTCATTDCSTNQNEVCYENPTPDVAWCGYDIGADTGGSSCLVSGGVANFVADTEGCKGFTCASASGECGYGSCVDGWGVDGCPDGQHRDDSDGDTCIADQTAPSCLNGGTPLQITDPISNPQTDGDYVCSCPIGSQGANCASGPSSGGCRTGFKQVGGVCVVDCTGDTPGTACGFGGQCETEVSCPADDCPAGFYWNELTLSCTAADGANSYRITNLGAGPCSGDSPCQNGGTCTTVESGQYHVCECPIGTTGVNCETCASGFNGAGCTIECSVVDTLCGYGGGCTGGGGPATTDQYPSVNTGTCTNPNNAHDANTTTTADVAPANAITWETVNDPGCTGSITAASVELVWSSTGTWPKKGNEQDSFVIEYTTNGGGAWTAFPTANGIKAETAQTPDSVDVTSVFTGQNCSTALTNNVKFRVVWTIQAGADPVFAHVHDVWVNVTAGGAGFTCDATHSYSGNPAGCDLGYGGADCGSCDTGYVRAPDGLCKTTADPENECSTACPTGTCIRDSSGARACVCDAKNVDDTVGSPGTLDCDVCGVAETEVDSCDGDKNACTAGYTGENCDTCSSGANYGDGTCRASDPCAGNGSCDTTYGTCYLDPADATQKCDCLGRTLSPNCSTGSGGAPQYACSCNTGYTGTACDQCAAGYVTDPSTGTCISQASASCPNCANGGQPYMDDTGTCVCDCVGNYWGANCGSCPFSSGVTWQAVTVERDNGSGNSWADGNGAGICEVCHQNTQHYTTSPTEQSKPGGDQHNLTARCKDCHPHSVDDVTTLGGRRSTWGFMPAPDNTGSNEGLCSSCHLSGAGGGQDVDSYVWNGVRAMIDLDEWENYGHGKPTTAAFPSGNTYQDADEFDVQPGNGCEYCHDDRVAHNDPFNFFRLRNYDVLQRGKCGVITANECFDGTDCSANGDADCESVSGEPANDVCLVCHSAKANSVSKFTNGYDPDSDGVEPTGNSWARIGSALDIDSGGPGVAFHHYLTKHTTNAKGGRFCWDCHDPHGDLSYDGTNPNYYMVQQRPTRDHASPDGRGLPLDTGGDDVFPTATASLEGLAAPVRFDPAGGITNGVWDLDDYRSETQTTTGDRALCRNCHLNTTKNCAIGAGACDAVGHPEDQSGYTNDGCVNQCHKHADKFKGVSANDNCYTCHAKGRSSDTLSYTQDGNRAYISIVDYGGEDAAGDPSSNTGTGHGRTGTTYTSGNAAAAFAGSGPHPVGAGCYYCHTPDTASQHNGADPYQLGNPFMLAINEVCSDGVGICGGNGTRISDGSPANWNNICTRCHSSSIPAAQRGYDPPQDNLGNNAPALCTSGTCVMQDKAITAHEHGSGAGNGKRCWHCHDPHGDGNSYMIQLNAFNNLAANACSPGGSCPSEVPINATGSDSGGLTAPITFTAGASPAWSDYKVAGAELCGNCHATQSYCNQSSCAAHNSGQACTNCHPHDGDFQGQGTCRSCHDSSQQPTTSPKRRAVLADFSLNSHHVGNGGTYMGGTLKDHDCVVCHAEGYSDGQCVASACSGSGAPCGTDDDCIKLGSSAVHMDGKIHLRHVDSAGSYFAYDKDCIANSSCTTGLAGSSTGVFNQTNPEWVAQTRNNLDPFCMTCHDYDGASVAAGGSYPGSWAAGGTGKISEGSATALNPFNDLNITNAYDQYSRPDGVVDIRSMVDADQDDATIYGAGNGACGGGVNPDGVARAGWCVHNPAITCTGDFSASCPTAAGIPARGRFSRHAIRASNPAVNTEFQNVAPSVYSDGGTQYIKNAGFFLGTWTDSSEMSCADCHTSDGGIDKPSLTNTGNAHGSNSEYLLLDNARGSTEGTYAAGSLICYQCHTGGYGKKHGSGNGSEWGDSMGSTGTGRLGAPGTLWGINCMLCHGGDTYGGIHGTSLDAGYGPGGGSGTRPSYRFTNGAVMRFMSPSIGGTDWTSSNYTCYTMSGSTAFSTCSQHANGKDGAGRNLTRPLSY